MLEVTRQNHSNRDPPLIACSHQLNIGVIRRAHTARDESHIHRNANREVATQHLN